MAEAVALRCPRCASTRIETIKALSVAMAICLQCWATWLLPPKRYGKE